MIDRLFEWRNSSFILKRMAGKLYGFMIKKKADKIEKEIENTPVDETRLLLEKDAIKDKINTRIKGL